MLHRHRMRPPAQRQAAGRDRTGRQRQNRGFRPFARRPQTGITRVGVGNDHHRVDDGAHATQGTADRIGAARLGCGLLGVDHLAVVGIALDAGNNAIHHVHGLDRILAGGGFSRQHHGVGTVVDRVGDIGDLGPGRHRRRHHGIQHVGGDHHRLAGFAAQIDDAFLQIGNLFRRQFDPQVAARHHDRVGRLDDGVQPVDRAGFFQLDDDRRAAGDQAAQFLDILRFLHERQRHPVHAQVQPVGQIGAILVGQCGQRQMGIGDIDALVVGHLAAGDDLAIGMLRTAIRHPQAYPTVVDQQMMARLQGGEDFRMRQARPLPVARRFIQIQPEAFAGLQVHRPVREAPDPQLGPLQIHHHPDRPALPGLYRADGLQPLTVLVMAAVAEVEPEHVGAGLGQGADGFGVRTGRS